MHHNKIVRVKMRNNTLTIAKLLTFLLLACLNVFAAQAQEKKVALTELEKFYGTELKSEKKVVHPPYA